MGEFSVAFISINCLLSDQDGGVTKPKIKVPSGEERIESPLPPVLELLWGFSCDLTTGHEVSCMAWNKKCQVSP